MTRFYPQQSESARFFSLLTCVSVLEKSSGRKGVCRANPALATHAFEERDMPLTRNTPGVRPAQEFTDPIITNARLVNLAAEIERNLAARKALRPARSAAASLGWETRRG